MDTIIQETERDSELAVAYQVNYTNRQGEKKYLFLSLDDLIYTLERSVRTFKCECDCSNLPTKALRNVDGPYDYEQISS